MNRVDYLSLIEASLVARHNAYAVQLARHWLDHWPNDVAIRDRLARAYMAQGQWQPAHQLTLDLAAADPENIAFAIRLADLSERLHLPQTVATARAAQHILTGKGWPNPTLPDWLIAARAAHTAQRTNDSAAVLAALNGLTLTDLPTPLPALALLRSYHDTSDYPALLALSQATLRRWPDPVIAILAQAEAHLHTGQSNWGVAWLHEAAALDPAGDIAANWWGRANPYASLWPAFDDLPLPAEPPDAVAALLGGRTLPPTHRADTLPAETAEPRPTNASPATAAATRLTEEIAAKSPNGRNRRRRKSAATPSEELRDISAELERVQADLEQRHSRPRKAARSFRTAVHVLLTSHQRLQAKFGALAAETVLQAVYTLADASEIHRPTYLLLVDDAVTLGELGLSPVDASNPWQIKHLLHDFDRLLTRKGQAIGSLLILGGDDVIPFHRLPNPVDDADTDIPSDNPYGTLDENYFLPEWPVGRLPSPCGSDPGPLLAMIHAAAESHRQQTTRLNGLKALLLRWLRALRKPASLGYTASIWRDASQAVFKSIGGQRRLFASPPHATPDLPRKLHAPHDLAYYNLHGLEDAPEWYGQNADPLAAPTDQFPVALRPTDVPIGARPPQIVFTEACYGANILNKTTPDAALCLQFLTAGSSAVIGSTRIAYGSVALPLIGADLLSERFWQHVLAGRALGEALRRARVDVAETMHRRQGFLDGEDQKTLISFVLYGDPLVTLPGYGDSAVGYSDKGLRRGKRAAPKTLPARGARPLRDDETAAAAPVRALLKRYLPGMETGEVQVLIPYQANAANAKSLSIDPQQRIYAVSKSITMQQHATRQYARVTVNGSGQIVKLSVSK